MYICREISLRLLMDFIQFVTHSDVFLVLKCVGIKFNVVPSRVMVVAENWTERWSNIAKYLLPGNISNLSINNATSQKVRLHAFDNRTLHHFVHIPADSHVSHILATFASICSARFNAWTNMDMQMEFGRRLCASN